MLKHTINAFFYSIDGLKSAFKDEIAFRLILLQSLLVIILIILFPLSYLEISFLLLAIAMCIIVELLNSAIENAVDLVISDWHIHAKKAKDMGSAAQLVSLLFLYSQVILVLKNYFFL